MPQGQAGNLQACFISDWHQIPRSGNPAECSFLKRSGRCAASPEGVIALLVATLCCTGEAGPGWGEEGLWVNPGSSGLRAREESKVSSQPIPFLFLPECMLSLCSASVDTSWESLATWLQRRGMGPLFLLLPP